MNNVPSKVILGVLASVALVALTLSRPDSTRRLQNINTAIEAEELGQIDDKSQYKLQTILTWLAKSSGITIPISVNGVVRKNQLDLIVTTPKYFKDTFNGLGNAIYDPKLDVIFIDRYLLEPVDLLHVGETGSFVMTTLDLSELDFVENYLTFIIAHELGHRQQNRKGGAFFALDWLLRSDTDVAAEVAADTYAVQLIAKAHRSGEPPDFIRENSLQFSGLQSTGSADALAAGQVFSAVVGMSLMMQFGRGPYSPFFHDHAHPDFLSRALNAVQAALHDGGDLARGQAPVVVEQMRYTQALQAWPTSELHFPGPIARAEARSGNLWIGVVPTSRGQPPATPLIETLYRYDGEASPTDFVPVATGQTVSEDELPGAWLNRLLEVGDAAIGLPAQSWWKTQNGAYRAPWLRRAQGFGYDKNIATWYWQTSGERREISEAALADAAAELFGSQQIEVGRPQWMLNTVAFPILCGRDDGPKELRILLINDKDLRITDSDISFLPEDGWILLDSVTYLENAWIALGETDSQDKGHYYHFWRIPTVGPATAFSSYPALDNFIGETGDPSYGRDLDASDVFVQRLNDRQALIWRDIGPVWLVSSEEALIAFNPGNKALQITVLDDDHALLWVSNARKGYLVDYGRNSVRQN